MAVKKTAGATYRSQPIPLTRFWAGYLKKLIYDINQRKLFFQQNAKDTTK